MVCTRVLCALNTCADWLPSGGSGTPLAMAHNVLRACRGPVHVEIDGPDIHPASIDPGSALGLAAAVLSALDALAKASGRDVTFTGLQVVDKCAALVTYSSDEAATRRDAQDLHAMLKGEKQTPKGLGRQVARISRVIDDLPDHMSAVLRVGYGSLDPVEVTLRGSRVGATRYESQETLRCRLTGLDTDPARVKVTNVLSGEKLSLKATNEQVEAFAGNLRAEFDITAVVKRSTIEEEGIVLKGELLEFAVVPEGPVSLKALRAWYRDTGKPWDGLGDWSAHLRMMRDES